MAVELLLRYLKLGIGIFVVWVLLWVYGTWGCHKMAGPDMEPNIGNEDFKFVSVKVRHPDQIMREQVIVYEFEVSGVAQTSYAARVLGLPGDRVKIVNGDVYVNDTKMSSNYVGKDNQSNDSMPEIIIPRDHFFVLADNRRNYRMRDSRGIGPVHFMAVLGTIE